MNPDYEAAVRAARAAAEGPKRWTDKPNGRGLYWVVWCGEIGLYYFEGHEFDNEFVWGIDDNFHPYTDQIHHWMGPITKPEPPK